MTQAAATPPLLTDLQVIFQIALIELRKKLDDDVAKEDLPTMKDLFPHAQQTWNELEDIYRPEGEERHLLTEDNMRILDREGWLYERVKWLLQYHDKYDELRKWANELQISPATLVKIVVADSEKLLSNGEIPSDLLTSERSEGANSLIGQGREFTGTYDYDRDLLLLCPINVARLGAQVHRDTKSAFPREAALPFIAQHELIHRIDKFYIKQLAMLQYFLEKWRHKGGIPEIPGDLEGRIPGIRELYRKNQ